MMIDLDFFAEPGAWGLIGLLFFATINLVSSILLRPTRKRLLANVQALVKTGQLNKSDQAWIRADIDRSRGAHFIVASLLAPVIVPAAAIYGFYDGWNGKTKTTKETLKDTRNSLEASYVKTVSLFEGHDPRKGNYWNDSRRLQIRDDADTLEEWNNPVAMIWVSFWLLFAFPLLLVGYLASGTMRPFFERLGNPLRQVVEGIVSALVPSPK